jgi:hypothetical protein
VKPDRNCVPGVLWYRGLLVADYRDGASIEPPESSDDGAVVAISAVAVQFNPFRAQSADISSG